MKTHALRAVRNVVLPAAVLMAVAIAAFGGPLLFEKEEYAARRTRLMDKIPAPERYMVT